MLRVAEERVRPAGISTIRISGGTEGKRTGKGIPAHLEGTSWLAMICAGEKAVSEAAHLSCGKCWREKACLEPDGAPKCRALRRITNDYLFVQDGRYPGCPNCVAFGADSHVCCCSIRNELHRKYGI